VVEVVEVLGGCSEMLVVVVVVVVMDFCVTEFWIQYQFLFTYPTKKLHLSVTASCWRAGQQCLFVSARFFTDHIFPCFVRNNLRQVILSCLN